MRVDRVERVAKLGCGGGNLIVRAGDWLVTDYGGSKGRIERHNANLVEEVLNHIECRAGQNQTSSTRHALAAEIDLGRFASQRIYLRQTTKFSGEYQKSGATAGTKNRIRGIIADP